MQSTIFLDFLMKHWVLTSILLVLVAAYVMNEWWMRKTGPKRLSAQGVVEQLNHHQAVLVDLRTTSEFEQGHIINAMHIAHDQLAEKVERLNDCKEKPLILVCGLGQKSLVAGTYLLKQGFLNVFYLVGGMNAWRSDNLPLEKS